MKIDNFKRKATPIHQDKYSLVFETNIQINGKSFTLLAYSVPIIVTSHNNQDTLAFEAICWDTAFASSKRFPFVTNPQVTWSRLSLALNAMYRRKIGRGLSNDNLNFLYQKLINIGSNQANKSFHTDYMIDRSQFSVLPVVSSKHEKIGKKKKVNGSTFFEWFEKTLLLTEEYLKDEWVHGYVHGFINKTDAHRLVASHRPGTFILRFSETLIGNLSIVYVDDEGAERTVEHFGITESELKSFNLQKIMSDLDSLKRLLSVDGKLIDKKTAFKVCIPSTSFDGYKRLLIRIVTR